MKSGRLPGHAHRLGAAPVRRLRRSARTCAAGARTIRSTTASSPIAGVDVQRRRRQHDPVRRALPALPPVGLPRPDARRRRRRLADRLRDARAVLRPQRAHDGRLRARRRSRLSAEGACRCRRCRSASSARRWRAASTGSAGTGGRRTARSSRASYEGRARLHQRRHVPRRLRAGRQGEHRHHLLARRRCARACSSGRAAACARSPSAPNGHGRRRHLLRRRRRRARAAARTSSCSPATASARRACCSTRARSTSPTASPTAAAWSART